MIFSVQNSNLLYSVELSPDIVQIQVRETVSEVFSEPRTPVSEPPVMEARPALRSIENL